MSISLFGIFVTCLATIVAAAWLLANQIGALRAQMEIMLRDVQGALGDLRKSRDDHNELSERVARLEERMDQHDIRRL